MKPAGTHGQKRNRRMRREGRAKSRAHEVEQRRRAVAYHVTKRTATILVRWCQCPCPIKDPAQRSSRPVCTCGGLF